MDEDVQKDAEEEVQKMTDKYAKQLDDLASAKEEEVLHQ
jgi:ribosome recycling factor